MQKRGMFLITVTTGFLLVAIFGLVAAIQARKAKPLLHQEVKLICIAKGVLLLGRVG